MCGATALVYKELDGFLLTLIVKCDSRSCDDVFLNALCDRLPTLLPPLLDSLQARIDHASQSDQEPVGDTFPSGFTRLPS